MLNVQNGWTHTEVPNMMPTLRTLVILDSDAGISQMLSIWCQAEAYSPVIAADTREFLHLVRLLRPDGAILDADQVPSDQCEVLADLLCQPPHNTMPLVITSWSECLELPVEASNRVTLATLAKPFTLASLKQTLERLSRKGNN